MGRQPLDPEPAKWSPPRGPRDPATGAWKWAWAARPRSSYGLFPEAETVATWRALVDTLVDERYARGWSLRTVAARSGLSLSVVNSVEQGSAWPTVATFEAVAEALEFTAGIDGEPGYGLVDGLMRKVRRRKRGQEEPRTPRQVAEFAGVRPATLYELPRAVNGGSIRTLLVIAQQADATITLTPRRGPPKDA